jgi:hypothetical protein
MNHSVLQCSTKPPKTSQSHEQPTLNPRHHRSIVKPCQHFPPATKKMYVYLHTKLTPTHTAAISISLLLPLLPPPLPLRRPAYSTTLYREPRKLKYLSPPTTTTIAIAIATVATQASIPLRRAALQGELYLLTACLLAAVARWCCALDIPCMSVCLRWDACMHAPRSLPSRRMCVAVCKIWLLAARWTSFRARAWRRMDAWGIGDPRRVVVLLSCFD